MINNGLLKELTRIEPHLPFLFNSRFGVQTDPNGLLYMRSRYYNPYISRFLNPDPRGFAGGLNFYLFCNDNPISETDPFGLDPAFSSIGIFSGLTASQEVQASQAAAPFVGGVVVGAAGAGVVVVGAPVAVSGLVALGFSQAAAAATVTVGVGATAVIGTSQLPAILREVGGKIGIKLLTTLAS